MPTDPNARRDKAIESIASDVKEVKKLAVENNRILKKLEKKLLPSVTITNHPYLKATSPKDDSQIPPPEELHEGPYGVGPSQDDR